QDEKTHHILTRQIIPKDQVNAIKYTDSARIISQWRSICGRMPVPRERICKYGNIISPRADPGEIAVLRVMGTPIQRTRKVELKYGNCMGVCRQQKYQEYSCSQENFYAHSYAYSDLPMLIR